jgi:hypothetical protein
MDRNQLMTYVAAVLTTALETEPRPFPESMAYLAMGADLSKWQTIKQVLVDGGMITTPGYSIQLTDKGRELAQKCNAVL